VEHLKGRDYLSDIGWENNITNYSEEMGKKELDYIHLAQVITSGGLLFIYSYIYSLFKGVVSISEYKLIAPNRRIIGE
jgi:hypothetical protein